MTNKRITELTALDGDDVANDDLLMIVDVSDSTMAATGTNKKITVAEFATDSTLGGSFVAKSTLTTDGDMLTRASGVPDRITRADLAQDSAFSSRYMPISGDRHWVPATNLALQQGSPAIGNVGGFPVWLLDQSSQEGVGAALFAPPSWWTTFHVDLYWSNAGSGATGDVVWDGFFQSFGDGDTLLTVTVTDVSVAAPAYEVVKVTRLVSSVSVSSGKVWGGTVLRRATSVSDTLNADAAVIGLMLTRAS